MSENNFPMFVVYDKTRKQIGCALLQAIYGGTIDNFSLMFFNNWLLFPTDELALYKINSQEKLDAVIELTNKTHSSFYST